MLINLNKELTEPQIITIENPLLDENAIWIDLFCPSKVEEEQVEHHIGKSIPSRAEMVEIEFSSRLYKENDAIFMTAMMLAQADSPEPKIDPVTFVLTNNQLITIRYIESQSFRLFISKLKKIEPMHRDPVNLLIELLDATVDRLADILELVASRLDQYSKTIFRPANGQAEKLNYQLLMQQIGATAILTLKHGRAW